MVTAAGTCIRRRPAGDATRLDGVPGLLQRIYAARGATDMASARPRLADLLPPSGLAGLDAALELLHAAIADGRRILVVGDFDCDGATACAVAVRGLRMLGAGDVVHAVPNRARHGYGLTPGLVEELAPLAPALLMTVDHGIACHAGIAAAKARGWRVLVTDHHLPGASLPPADAIVNPNQAGDGFGSRMLAGVGVAFYVLLALRARLQAAGRLSAPPPDLADLLDLVAVGTVADLVPLDANNRALVSAGLRRLRAGRGCEGLKALIAVSGRDPSTLTASDIGFAIAPRINAAGRLEDMGVGIDCLLSDDPGQALQAARLLDRINAERRVVQQAMLDEAESALARAEAPRDAARLTHCLFDASWHPGVVGLVASRVKERLHRPVIAFAPAAPDAALLRGSARSIPGCHVRDLLARVDALHPGLIERFGGHAMAAGLSLPRAALPAFAEALERCARDLLASEALEQVLWTDGPLAPGEFDIRTAQALRDGGPWGQAFPEPLFDGDFSVRRWRVVGERHLKLELDMDGRGLAAIQFNGWTDEPPPARVRLAYRLEPDAWRGGDAIQLVVVHREPAPLEPGD